MKKITTMLISSALGLSLMSTPISAFEYANFDNPTSTSEEILPLATYTATISNSENFYFLGKTYTIKTKFTAPIDDIKGTMTGKPSYKSHSTNLSSTYYTSFSVVDSVRIDPYTYRITASIGVYHILMDGIQGSDTITFDVESPGPGLKNSTNQ